MMTEGTARFALPQLAAGQAQKDVTHNEALALVDALLHPVVETMALSVPPAAPEPGRSWLVGAAPVGEWAGRAGQLACRTPGGWRYCVPVPGMTVWLSDRSLIARWTGTAWVAGVVTATRLLCDGVQVVGSRQAAITAPSGGGTVDQEARGVVSAILEAMRAHGLITT